MIAVGSFDVIVVGVGAMGSSVCAHLAARGARVLGIDRHAHPHEFGSSGGDTRLFRTSYFEHTDYVPLLRRARAGWSRLEEDTGVTVFYETGVLYAGPADGHLIRDTEASARAYEIPLEELGDAADRFPQFALPDGYRALFEPGGGLVLSAWAIGAYGGLARHAGAQLRPRERVLGWEETGDGVVVRTDAGRYTAAHLVLAAGAWTSALAPSLAGFLTPTRQVLGWVRPDDPDAFSPPRFAAWAIEDPSDGLYYGFPIVGGSSAMPERAGIKVGRHVPGPEADPDTVDRGPAPPEDQDFLPGVARYLPSAGTDVLSTMTCLYTNSPDGHFLVGALPGAERVSVAAGFSGHGFKFAPVIGEALADLALEGSTELPIGFLDPDRFDGT
ncbi:MAG: N-methyl-L-tryptophan oxidase [Gemmatimonadota bacterium]